MAINNETRESPLLSWKGMQLWSVGYRAPAVCEMFIGLKTKKLSNLVSLQKKQRKGKRRKQGEGGDGIFDLSEEDADSPQAVRCSSLELPGRLSCHSIADNTPHRHSVGIECTGRISDRLNRKSNAMVSNFKHNLDNSRRNSDASLNHLQHLSFFPSAFPPHSYERVWTNDSGGQDDMIRKDMKLGGRHSDESAQLGRQDSSMSTNHRSSCSSSSSSVSSVASATSAIAKLVHAGRRSSAGCDNEQRHLISQLLVGNQFLTHLTAAPVLKAEERMHPSGGLLLDASMRGREAELKERIIFFL